jgi:hypothetical protein
MKNCLSSMEGTYLSYLHKKFALKLTAVIIKEYHYYQLYIKFVSNVVLSRLTPHTADITGDHQCGFQCNRPTL